MIRVPQIAVGSLTSAPVISCSAGTNSVPLGAGIRLRSANNSADYRAAAYLRAQSFYTYPSDRSEYARRAHLRMKADDMWEQLEEKTAQEGDDPSQPIVVPIIATAISLNDVPIASLLDDASVALPTEGEPEFVIGTLDVNICSKLPAEELIGRLPNSPAAATKRAYLSNVCVLSAARRQGIASNLIEEACKLALERGVEHMYVHVVADNEPARLLYENHCGFTIEQQENESTARALNRPRRLLLHRALSSLSE